jgi:hypothetical protein
MPAVLKSAHATHASKCDASVVAGLGQRSIAWRLGPHVRVAADSAPHIIASIVAWVLLTLVYYSATGGGRLRSVHAIRVKERAYKPCVKCESELT